MRNEEKVRRRPRTGDYVMWAVVALTMVLVLRGVFSVDSAVVQTLGLGYFAVGAVLLLRRWHSLSR